MQESFVDAAPHLCCSKVHPQPLTDRQPSSPTAQLLGGRHEDRGQVTISRREGGAHPAPLHLPKPHHHSDWSSCLSGETQQLNCPCSATQIWLLSPHLPAEGLQPQPRKASSTGTEPQQPQQESCPKAQEGQHSPGCPWLPRHRGRRQTTHVHGRVTCASTVGGPWQPPADNRWFLTGTAQSGFELVPKHRKLQAPSSAPSEFSSQRRKRKKSLYVESLH